MATSSTDEIAERLKKYIENPEVMNVYEAIKVSAKVVDVASSTVKFLTKPEFLEAVAKMAPVLSSVLKNVSDIAKGLGPAGLALGVAVDLITALGLRVLDAGEVGMASELEKISRKLDNLHKDVVRGFRGLRTALRIHLVLNRFLPTYDNMLSRVQLFERLLLGIKEADFADRLKTMVNSYQPIEIIVDLKKMHNLITGAAGFCKPFFEELAEEGNELEGAEFDQFMSTVLLQFQSVVGLEMRAVRMLRSFLAYREEDTKYAKDLNAIFQNLAVQRDQHDPTVIYKWYLDFKAYGGHYLMTPTKWPDYYLYMQKRSDGNVEGSKGHPGDQGVFKIKPHVDGTFLVSTKEWPDRYMYMKDNNDGNVRGSEDEPDAKGQWYFAIVDAKTHTFVVTTKKWPNRYMFMQKNMSGDMEGCYEDPGPQGHFKLFFDIKPL